MMVLPKPLPSCARRRPDLLAGAILALLCAAIAMPAAAAGAGPLTPGAAAPRSRLHVEIPGYTAYYVPPDEAAAPSPAAPVPPSAVATAAITPEPAAAPAAVEATPAPVERQASDRAAGNLVAAAKAPVSDATAGLVLGYTPGNVGVPAAAETQLHALADRMRRDPTMIIALEGFAGGGDSLKARRLAMWRARAVRTRLLEDGVAEQRIRLRAAEADAGAAATERVDVRIVQP